MIYLTSFRKLQITGYTFELQEVDKHSRNSYKYKFSMRSLTSSCFMCALNLYFAKRSIKGCRAQFYVRIVNWTAGALLAMF